MSSSFMNLSSFIIMTFTGYKIENSKAKYHTFCSKKWCKKILKLVWHMPTNKYWDFPLNKVHNAQTNLRAQYITLSHLSSTLTQLWVISPEPDASCFHIFKSLTNQKTPTPSHKLSSHFAWLHAVISDIKIQSLFMFDISLLLIHTYNRGQLSAWFIFTKILNKYRTGSQARLINLRTLTDFSTKVLECTVINRQFIFFSTS